MSFPVHVPPEKLTIHPELTPGFPDDVSDPGRDPIQAVLSAVAALPPRPAPIVLPSLGGNVQDVVRQIVRTARPGDEQDDENFVERLKAQVGSRCNSAQYATRRGNFDQARFILQSVADLREISRLSCKWSGAELAAPEVIFGEALALCRSIDAWSTDGFLLAQHASLVKTTDLDQAHANVQHLADNCQRGEIPCGRTEHPQDSLFRFLTEAVEQFQAVQALSQALGTADDRAAAVQAAISTAGRDKVTQATSRGMPYVNRSHAIEAQLLRLQNEKDQTHPRTAEFIELSQKIEVAKSRLTIALEAEKTERDQAAEALVSSTTLGSLPHIAELQDRTASSLPAFSVDLRRARANDAALTAVIGFLVHSDDEKRAAVQREIARR